MILFTALLAAAPPSWAMQLGEAPESEFVMDLRRCTEASDTIGTIRIEQQNSGIKVCGGRFTAFCPKTGDAQATIYEGRLGFDPSEGFDPEPSHLCGSRAQPLLSGWKKFWREHGRGHKFSLEDVQKTCFETFGFDLSDASIRSRSIEQIFGSSTRSTIAGLQFCAAYASSRMNELRQAEKYSRALAPVGEGNLIEKAAKAKSICLTGQMPQ